MFIDEAGANLAMIRLYARAPREQRVVGTRPQRRGQNVLMVRGPHLNQADGWALGPRFHGWIDL